MAISHATATRNVLAQRIQILVDTGAGANGTLKIKTAGAATLVSLPMSSTSFGTSVAGVITANAITTTPATAAGTAANFDICDKDGTAVISGTVGTSGSDINLTNTNIAIGDPISITTLTYTAPT
jgi:hypothetical protein